MTKVLETEVSYYIIKWCFQLKDVICLFSGKQPKKIRVPFVNSRNWIVQTLELLLSLLKQDFYDNVQHDEGSIVRR